MTYTPTTWTDETLYSAERFDIKEDGGAAFKSTMQIVLSPGILNTAGTILNAAAMNKIEQGIANAPLSFYPIGSIYMSVLDTTPATLFGGTWAAFGTGRVLVGIDTGYAPFETAENIGGEIDHTLTVDELPAHHHNIASTNAVSGSGKPSLTSSATGMNFNTDDAGGDVAHNNMPPYIIVYMWKRTA